MLGWGVSRAAMAERRGSRARGRAVLIGAVQLSGNFGRDGVERAIGRKERPQFSPYVPGLDYQELIARYLLKASMHMLRAASGTDQWRKFEKGRR